MSFMRWARAALLTGLVITSLNGRAARAEGGGGGTGAPPPGGSSWITENVISTMDDVGKSASLAQETHRCNVDGVLTHCHTIGVAYLDATTNQLRFSTSYNEGQSFGYNVVDGPDHGGSVVDGHISLTYYGSTPVISYHDAATNRLKVAKRVGFPILGNCGSGQWDCRTLQVGGRFTSVDVDAGTIYISHATASGSLALSTFAFDYSGTASQTVFSNGSVKATKLRIDALHRPHLVWSDGVCVRYKWALFEGDEVVECSPANVGLNLARIDMVLGSNHIPHVSYSLKQATGSVRVRYAFKLSTDTPDWEQEAVDTVPAPSSAVPMVVDTSIVLNADGDDVGAIAWGTRTVTGITSEWKLHINYPNGLPAWSNHSVVDATGGQNSSMIRIPDGTLGIAHYYPTTTDLRYSREN